MTQRIGDFEILGISLLDDVTIADPKVAPSFESVAPRTPVEEAVAELWLEILGAAPRSIHANFFELGGDSLMAGQVIARVRQVFGIEPPFQEMFQPATIAGMAEKIEAALRDAHPLPAPPLTPVSRDQLLPLSFSQERMWFIHQLDPQSAAYNVAGAIRLKGQIDPAAFRASMQELARRHESLRTAFPVVDGSPIQKILPPMEWNLPIIDLSTEPLAERYEHAVRIAADLARAPFDLNQAPLFHTTIVRLAPDDHVMVMNMHHIISDAWSMGVFGRELITLYNAYAQGTVPALPDLPIQYADFAVWQRQWLQGEVLEAHLEYWREKLAGASVLELPTDRPRPLIQTYRGGLQSFEPDPALFAGLHTLSRREGVTLFMTLLAAFDVLLYRYTAQSDIAVAVPIANRNWLELENLIGAFVNTLVVRTDISGNPTFRELLARVRTVAVQAYAHQDMPFAKLVAELKPERDTSYTPFVQVMFNVINVPMPQMHLGDTEFDVIELDRLAAQFDLTCTISDVPEFRRVVMDYNSDLFDDATITRLLAHYRTLLDAVVAHPDTPILDLPLLSPAELSQLDAWNDTTAPYPQAETIPSLFESQVARTPDSIALRFEGGQLTYRELNTRANQLASQLLVRGVAVETPVGVMLERSPELVIALLGVMKVGAAFVPLSPDAPAERLAFILQDTHAPIVVTRTGLANRLPISTAQTLCLDELPNDGAAENPNVSLTPDNLAYIVYTSGSTGQPKGVLGLHRGAVNRFASMWTKFPYQANEVACYKSPFTFVDSILELFAPLTAGIPVVILSDIVVRDPAQLLDALAQNHVTRLLLVPSLLRVLLDTQTNLAARLPYLHYWIAGGEALSADLRDAFYAQFPDAVLINLYGASEASGDSAIHDTRASRDLPYVPIGRPILNTQLYVLDANQQRVPVGVHGELFVSGVSLARGYLNQPELTAEKFVANPFGAGHLYKTGDVVSFLPDGNLRYLGRRDQQVKVRGMRVELGEIENILRTHPSISDAAVLLRAENGSEPRLVGYVAAQTQPALTSAEVRRFVRTQMPEYMVPQDIVVLETLPTNSSGKVDRLRLPAPDRANSARVITPPDNSLEHELQHIWHKVLEIQPIGMDDDFFDLGGHSLLAIRLFAEIDRQLGRKIPVASIFQTPTIRALAEGMRQTRPSSVWSPLVPIQPQGTRTPFFCVHGLGGGVIGYAALARLLGNDQPFYGLQAYGLEPGQPSDTSVQAMAARYITTMQELQPHGPYLLGGYSYGGTVAFEMAQQLTAQDETVALLAMFDHPAPNSEYLRVQLNSRFVKGFLKNVPAWTRDYLGLDARQQRGKVRRAGKALLTLQKERASETVPFALEQFLDDVSQVPPERRELMQIHLSAAAVYQPQPYAGRVTVFRTPRQPLWSSYDPALGWEQFAREVEIRQIAGAHRNLLEEPYVEVLARELSAALAAIAARV